MRVEEIEGHPLNPGCALQVQVQVQERAVSILALCSTRVFVLELSKLYSGVQPGRFLVQTKGCRLTVKLFKTGQATWPLLRG